MKIGFIQIILTIAILFCLSACNSNTSKITRKPKHEYTINSTISWQLCSFQNVEELQDEFTKMIKSLKTSDLFLDRMCNTYRITNGAASFVFVQIPNGLRGMPIFSLYCYQKTDSRFVLRSYIPVCEFWYRDILGHDLQLMTPTNLAVFNDKEYTKVVYRNRLIFAVSTNWYF